MIIMLDEVIEDGMALGTANLIDDEDDYVCDRLPLASLPTSVYGSNLHHFTLFHMPRNQTSRTQKRSNNRGTGTPRRFGEMS